ncbi:putative methyl-accepting chemotaxis sensory transducer [Mycobacteroides abscessus subsp. bolletii]|nr:putative methyl-accepting chemotaxis sensory transducer [Mycobacteroides abscessus subsp. bolletii]SKX39495.1 putative methyl-accepting chemotaxis sensory transducer [Mycobacteroides abscessus subsp. bolletii]
MENSIIGENWPADPVAAQAAYDNYDSLAKRFDLLADQTHQDAIEQREMLRGQAGDAHYDATMRLAETDYAMQKNFADKKAGCQQRIDITYGAQKLVAQIAAEGRAEHDAYIKAKNPSGAAAVIGEYRAQVEGVVETAVSDVKALQVAHKIPKFDQSGHPTKASAVDHKTPVSPGNSDGSIRALDHEKKVGDPHSKTADDVPVDRSHSKTVSPEKGDHEQPKDINDKAKAEDPNAAKDVASKLSDAESDHAKYKDPQAGPSGTVSPASPIAGMPGSGFPQSPGMGGGSSSGMGSGAGSGMGGLSGLSSQASSLQSGLGGAKSSMPSGLGSGGGSSPTMPSSSGSSASPASSFGEGMRSASSGFNSGLVSGMGASSPVPTQPQPLQPYAGSAGGATAAAMPAAASSAVPPAAAPVSPAPNVGMGGGSMGGGGFMPPGAMGGGAPVSSTPPAPYSVPHGTPPPSAGTTPAASPTGSTSPAGQGAGGTVGSAGAPLMAAAHTTSMQAPKPVNQDLQLAEHIVQLLIRSDVSSPVEWAVSVIRTATGPQVYVASNVAGGTYIPSHIFLPTPVKLAAYDHALPVGWFKKWFGWSNPMDILSDHYQRTLIAVRGARATAMATSRPLSRPADPNVPWAYVNRNELAPGPGTRPDGAHQHRLTAHDPALVAQIRNLNPQQQFQLAVAVTKSVITMTIGPDGQATADKTDTDMLDKVSAGTATNADWTAYKALVRDADLEPALHAPQSDEDSENARRERVQYASTFKRARVKEMISYWETMPPNVYEVAYNALAVEHNVAGTLAALQASLVAAR